VASFDCNHLVPLHGRLDFYSGNFMSGLSRTLVLMCTWTEGSHSVLCGLLRVITYMIWRNKGKFDLDFARSVFHYRSSLHCVEATQTREG